MGYKIEIILISIAIFLTGLIVVFNVLKGDEPEPIVVEKYFNGSEISENLSVNKNETSNKLSKTDISQEILQTESAQVQADKNSNKEDYQKININTASKDELMGLNGIGEALSERIIEYRKVTKFNSIEEIKNVYGIGEKTFEKLKDSITV